MPDCIFCKIVKGEVPTKKVYESDEVIAFPDINPKSPVHILIVPKRHIPTLNDFPPDGKLALALFDAVRSVAKSAGVAESGYRLIANTNRDGGQEVFHIHFHLLGGRRIGTMVI